MDFNQFCFDLEVPAEFVVACSKPIQITSCVVKKACHEYLLKQDRSIWLQGNVGGPCRLSFHFYPSKKSQRKTRLTKN